MDERVVLEGLYHELGKVHSVGERIIVIGVTRSLGASPVN